MGTRADYYVGRGEHAEWLGSTGSDGYPGGMSDTDLLGCIDETDFRDVIASQFANRRDFTSPDEGWPWPWEDSHTTDYSYAFDGGAVWVSCFGHSWKSPSDAMANDAWDDEDDDDKPTIFPNMKDRMNVQFGGPKSGMMVFSIGGLR